MQDINDNAPVFDDPFYAVTLAENTPIGTPLVTVSATDRDIERNGEVLYTINVDNPLVEVNSTSGVVTLTAVPDYEAIQALVVEV